MVMMLSSLTLVHADYSTTATIHVEQKYENKRKDVTPSASFEYVLCANEEGNPMPEESLSDGFHFVMDGNTSKDIAIEFTRVGIYTYSLYQTTASKDGYQLDDEVYKITIEVINNNGLQATVHLPINKKGEKEESIAFTNTFQKKDSGRFSLVNTGDPTQVIMWSSVLLLPLIGLILSVYLEYKIRKGGKEE